MGGMVQGPDGTLYGTASQNGGGGPGSVFKVNPDGTGFTILKQFPRDPIGVYPFPEGSDPEGSLVVAGATLYGTTAGGGTNGCGTVFELGTDGSNFAVLHHFDGSGSFGEDPMGGLVLDGATLWGTTAAGGNPGSQGTVFFLKTDETGFGIQWFFSGPDGRTPMALLKSGTWLYGTTQSAGSYHFGSVFRMNTDISSGSGFAEHLFNGDDGRVPMAGLVLSGTNLYGTTTQGGSNSCGTLFRVGTNIENLVVLRHFTSAEGNPSGGLACSGQTLYGVTQPRGTLSCGTVFKVNTDGSEFTVLKEFAGGSDDGDTPTGLIFGGTTLYGTTMYGGDPSGQEGPITPHGAGVIFSLSLAPALSLINPARAGTNFSFAFQSVSNQSYTVEYKRTLQATNWLFLETLTGSGSLLPCLVPMTNTSQCFFRVREP